MRELEIAPGLGGRLYTPGQASDAKGPLPLLVYLHGGGWVGGSVVTHDPFCRLLAEAAQVVIASVDYRLAPEEPYPAALDDALAAFRAARIRAAEWGGDPRRLALGGDSAGANLAAVAANLLSARGETADLRALLLLFPVTDHPSANHASYTENATGNGLEAGGMRWFWQKYAPHVSPDDPSVSPLRLHTLPALPPSLVATAEYDVLRDEGLAYAKKLRDSGVAVKHLHAPQMNHNFPVSPALVARFPQSIETLQAMSAWLRETLHTGV